MRNMMTTLLILSIALFMAGCGEEAIMSPTVSILSPDDRAYVSGEVDIVIDAYSDTEISKIEVYIDGELATTLTEATEDGLWSWKWDTREVLFPELYAYDYYGNLHTIYAKAEDADGEAAGTDVIGVIVRDYVLKDITYSNWRYNFQISSEGTDWGVITFGQLPGTYFYGSISGVVSVTPDAHYYGSQGNVVFLVYARPYLENLEAYEEAVSSQLEAAYEDPYDPNRVRVDIHGRKGYEMHGVSAREFEFRVSARGVEGKVICFVKDETGYVLYMVVGSGLKYSDHSSEFNQLVMNFKFL